MDADRQLTPSPFPDDQGLADPATRRACAERDKECRFPDCHQPSGACVYHHVVHWADGGPTTLDNLVLLCRRHHTLAHLAGRTLTPLPGGRYRIQRT